MVSLRKNYKKCEKNLIIVRVEEISVSLFMSLSATPIASVFINLKIIQKYESFDELCGVLVWNSRIEIQDPYFPRT